MLYLQDLLAVENDPELFEYRCPETGYMLWPLVRNQFLRGLISRLYYKQALSIAPPSFRQYLRALTALPHVLLTNARRGMLHGQVMVMGTGAGHFQREGRWFNRITDYLALASPDDTVTLEGLSDWHVPEPRWNNRTIYALPWQGAIAAAGYIHQREQHVRVARSMLAHVRQRSRVLVGLDLTDTQSQIMVGLAASRLARLPVARQIYLRLLDRVAPKLVLAEEGCYGRLAVFNIVAREMGVRVAEPQHGMVSSGHDAYCFAPIWVESDEFRQYLPHDFLGYGSWWNDQINVPAKKWVIGHPHYSEQRKFMNGTLGKKTDILLLSDGVDFSLYFELARELVQRLKGRFQVVLRPHPMERQRIIEKYQNGCSDGVTIDLGRNIYQSFVSAYAVAGEVSTGLFEAVGLAEKILLWETPKARFSYPQHPFVAFTDAETLAELILDSEKGRSEVVEDELWAPDWLGNYRSYLAQVMQVASA